MKFSRKKIGMAVFLVLALIASAVVLRMRQGASGTEQHAAHEKATYYCPMHPTYTSDRPGDCPICNMRLVKRESPKAAVSEHGAQEMPADEVPGYAVVSLRPQEQQRIGVKTALVEKRRIMKTIRTTGRIAHDPELYQAQEEYLQALRALKKAQGAMNAEVGEQARRLVEAAHMRLRLLGLSDELIEPMGSWEGPDKRLLLADSEGSVWVYASIYEFELPLVQVGQEVQVEIPSSPGKNLKAVIQSIDPVVDPETRSARVRALLTDPSRSLKPQMYVNISLKVDRGEVLSIPKEAVFDTGARRIVFVDKGQGFFEPRDVMVGVTADGYDEVREGVAEGEQVVVNGNFLIDSESRLQAALEGSAPAEDHPHVH